MITYLLILITLTACAAPNYQERRLYYNEQDNCCIEKGTDKVVISVTFNDRPKLEQTIDGETGCKEFAILYANMIFPAELMTYYECHNQVNDPKFYCDKLLFAQNATYQTVGFRTSAIIQNATIKNPAKFDSHEYNCVIEGDGHVHHFGPVGQVATPRIQVTCTRISQNLLF